MQVTVEVVGEDTREVDLAGLPTETPTYADLVALTDYSIHEVSVMVDGSPVPEDQPVTAEHVTILRLIQGG